MISQKLEYLINNAIKKANSLAHEYLTLEGMLWAMMEDTHVREIIESCGGSHENITVELEKFFKEEENFSILNNEQIDDLGKTQFVDEELRKLAFSSGIRYQPEVSLGVQRVIQRAAMHVQSSGKKQIRGINLLVAMFQEKESFALYTILNEGVDRFSVVKAIAHGDDKPLTSNEDDDQSDSNETDGADVHQIGDQRNKKKQERSVLDEFTVNLNLEAKKGLIDPIVGRQTEILRIIQILCRRRKNNPLLVGEAGVGKTAIAEGLAIRIIEEDVPEILLNTTIYALDLASLLAGAKFRGDFEKRLKGVLKALEKKLNEDGEKTILFIDELHMVMGAGATGNGSMDASNLLKPALSSGKVRVMGSTTYEEYRKFIEKDPAFSRRFQKVDIDEPSIEDTYKILQGLRPKFEEYHGVKYSNPVIKETVDLAARYITDRKNPDKSIDIIDEAGAAIQLLPESKRRTKVTKKDIEKIVAQFAKIPKISVVGQDKDKLSKLYENLKLKIYGQDEAVSIVTDAIITSKSGLGSEGRPIANFLFAGPTGVGKTELAKQLSYELNSELQRFDMSEYMEKHSVAKLIGAPPGYVGHDRGGLLTDVIKKQPYSVLLLDEIEKAHPDLFNILLQVMDHGTLTDSHGRVTDFRNVVLIMTTNAGAKEMEGGSISLSDSKKSENLSKRDKAIKNYFTPEFRNRLDSIIHFKSLDQDFILRIVDKFLAELEQKLALKNVEIEVLTAAKKWLADNGYDPQMGARPLLRLIDVKIKKTLSREVLFGSLSHGGKVIIGLNKEKNELKFDYCTKNS
jgi:ATP-dependent Clp protease ATP-binding subunit ClpA